MKAVITKKDVESYFEFDNMTFEDLHKEIQGHKLPIEITFKEPIFEDDFVESGMRAFLVGIDSKESVNSLYFYFGHHEEYNEMFFRANYTLDFLPEYDVSNKKSKNPTAIECGMYERHYSVYVDKSEIVGDYLFKGVIELDSSSVNFS
jgi:hypothetical protein